jgi:hypothetical protein
MIELSRKELAVYKIMLTNELGRDIIDRERQGQEDTGTYDDWPMMLKIEIKNTQERLRQP